MQKDKTISLDKISELDNELEKFITEKTMEASQNKDYLDMMAKYKKSLTKINKDASINPWEYSYGLDYFVEFLRFMQEYYKLGINVFAAERRDEDPKKYRNILTRYESISKALNYYDKWQNLEDEYITIIECKEKDKELSVQCKYKYGSARRTYRKLNRAKAQYKRLFFNTISEYIEFWWD